MFLPSIMNFIQLFTIKEIAFQLPISHNLLSNLIQSGHRIVREPFLNLFWIYGVGANLPKRRFSLCAWSLIILSFDNWGEAALDHCHIAFKFILDEVVNDGIFTVPIIVLEILSTPSFIHPDSYINFTIIPQMTLSNNQKLQIKAEL